ncbi:MAG: hypothetical protein J6M57_04650 [Acidaminococcaceae bacterium]|nr:hypothetical protein [Acidaminococcaceae bacterium]MBP3264937.1 hypothetical protein [Acidaminococcaceae bacterium]
MITDISKILTVNADGIPGFLKSKPYWINWKPVCADGKVKKLPTYGEAVLRGRYWDTSGRTFAEAFRTMPEQGGVSLLLSMENPLACIDIDDCNGDDPRLLKILQLVPNAWHELSPSGHGIHVWGVLPGKKAYLLPGRNQIGYHGSEYEWYGSGRAITVTGHPLKENRQTNPKNTAAVTENNFPGTKSPAGSFEAALPEYYFRGNCLPDLTPAVAFCESLRPKTFFQKSLSTATLPVESILQKAFACDPELQRMFYEGHSWQDKSREDFSFCCRLWFWLGSHGAHAIETVFERSALYRRSKGAHYVGLTVRNAGKRWDGNYYGKRFL